MQPCFSIEAASLTKTYPGGFRALDGLGLTVASGTVFGLVGPNGAGKFTTVKILTTLSRPDAGEAHVAGIDVLHEAERVRCVIGCVAQRSGVDIELTGRENLMLQANVHGLPRRRAKRRVFELLEQFGLDDAAGRVVRTYSGGMRRKLDVAMGLVHTPAVLFLDEPTTGLDPEARAELWAEITRLSRNDGLTVLFRRVVEIPGFTSGSYADYLTPGIAVMSVVFSAGWSGMGIIEDIDRGVLDHWLVSPVRRSGLIAGRVLYQAIITVIQTAIILVLGLIVGARFTGGISSVVVFVVAARLGGAGRPHRARARQPRLVAGAVAHWRAPGLHGDLRLARRPRFP